jgi:hypothetical protein
VERLDVLDTTALTVDSSKFSDSISWIIDWARENAKTSNFVVYKVVFVCRNKLFTRRIKNDKRTIADNVIIV